MRGGKIMQETIPTWLGLAGGVALGHYSGLSFLIPLALTVSAYFIGKRIVPTDKQLLMPVIACQIGVFGWMLIGSKMAPALFQQTLFDLLIITIGIIWLYFSKGRAAAIALTGYNCLALLIYSTELPTLAISSTASKALVVHFVWHAAAIVLLIAVVRARSSQHRQIDQRTTNVREHVLGGALATMLVLIFVTAGYAYSQHADKTSAEDVETFRALSMQFMQVERRLALLNPRIARGQSLDEKDKKWLKKEVAAGIITSSRAKWARPNLGYDAFDGSRGEAILPILEFNGSKKMIDANSKKFHNAKLRRMIADIGIPKTQSQIDQWWSEHSFDPKKRIAQKPVPASQTIYHGAVKGLDSSIIFLYGMNDLQ